MEGQEAKKKRKSGGERPVVGELAMTVREVVVGSFASSTAVVGRSGSARVFCSDVGIARGPLATL